MICKSKLIEAFDETENNRCILKMPLWFSFYIHYDTFCHNPIRFFMDVCIITHKSYHDESDFVAAGRIIIS